LSSAPEIADLDANAIDLFNAAAPDPADAFVQEETAPDDDEEPCEIESDEIVDHFSDEPIADSQVGDEVHQHRKTITHASPAEVEEEETISGTTAPHEPPEWDTSGPEPVAEGAEVKEVLEIEWQDYQDSELYAMRFRSRSDSVIFCSGEGE
jgi:hypothetical protein